MPRIRPQFSLATLLLLVTVACVGVALWSTARELQRLRAENQQYRDESGYLTISDTNKLHVIQVPATDGNVWRWRVFVPEDRNFWLYLNVGSVPSFGSGSGSGTMLPAGENVMSASIAKDIAGKRVLQVDFGPQHDTITTGMDGDRGDWIDQGNKGWMTSTAGRDKTQSAEPGQPLELIRLRAMEIFKEKQPDGGTSTRATAPDGTADGFLIWINDSQGGKTGEKGS